MVSVETKIGKNATILQSRQLKNNKFILFILFLIFYSIDIQNSNLTTSTPLEPLEETKDDDEEDSLPETEDDEEEENSVPDHHLDITTSERKSGKMKGLTREKVSLTIGNYIFFKRKKAVGADGVFLSYSGCETQVTSLLK